MIYLTQTMFEKIARVLDALNQSKEDQHSSNIDSVKFEFEAITLRDVDHEPIGRIYYDDTSKSYIWSSAEPEDEA